MADFKFNSVGFTQSLHRYLERRLDRILLFLEKEIKELISRGNLTGTNPSKPGEPPKVVTGALRASVAFHREGLEGAIGIRRGIADKYARSLELGRPGMAPRPFLRSTILKNRIKIIKMLER